jgi:hypothetical protein
MYPCLLAFAFLLQFYLFYYLACFEQLGRWLNWLAGAMLFATLCGWLVLLYMIPYSVAGCNRAYYHW